MGDEAYLRVLHSVADWAPRTSLPCFAGVKLRRGRIEADRYYVFLPQRGARLMTRPLISTLERLAFPDAALEPLIGHLATTGVTCLGAASAGPTGDDALCYRLYLGMNRTAPERGLAIEWSPRRGDWRIRHYERIEPSTPDVVHGRTGDALATATALSIEQRAVVHEAFATMCTRGAADQRRDLFWVTEPATTRASLDVSVIAGSLALRAIAAPLTQIMGVLGVAPDVVRGLLVARGHHLVHRLSLGTDRRGDGFVSIFFATDSSEIARRAAPAVLAPIAASRG